MRVFTAVALLFVLALLIGGSGAVRAQEAPARRAVIVLVPGLRAEDLPGPELPALPRLITEGASGWLVCRGARTTDAALLTPGGRETSESLLLTLGSGARAVAGPEVRSIVDHGAVSATALRQLRERNARLDYVVPVGALGDAVHRAGLKTAFLGDADPDTPENASCLLAMDSDGQTDSLFPALDLSDPAAPFGYRADVAALIRRYRAVAPDSRLIVLAFGDLSRADRYAPLCLPAAVAAQRTAALHALDSLLAAIADSVKSEGGAARTRLFVLAPGPADSVEGRQDRLAPLILWGAGIAPGTLASASARRAGLAVNTDFLPSVADFLGLPLPNRISGRALTVATGSPMTPESLRGFHDDVIRIAQLQTELSGPYLFLILVGIGLFASIRLKSRPLAGACAFAVAALPLGMVVLPLVSPHSVIGAGTLLAVFLLAAAAFAASRAKRRQGMLGALAGVCGLFVAVVTLDLLTGSYLMSRAWMSYSAVEGARFYGIGNEYMGATIGAACVLLSGIPMLFRTAGDARSGTAAAHDRKSGDPGPAPSEIPVRVVAGFGALFLLLMVVMGASRWGAKVGAIPSAGPAFGAALLMLRRGRIRVRDVAVLTIAVAAVLGVLLWFDLRQSAGQQSHLARAFLGEGGGSLPEILMRKLKLEGYLLLHSPWSAALLLSAGGLFRLRHFRAASVTDEFQAGIDRAVTWGIVTGAIVSLLVNDAGVIAATLVLLYGWAWAVIRGLDGEREKSQQDEQD